MGRKLFSKTLLPFEGEIENAVLRESLSVLKQYIGARKIRILSWSNDQIAIPLKLSVELPPLGTFDEIDIRSTEDVLFVFHLTEYPRLAPHVYTDRLDFPKNKLAHLYIAVENFPPAFCYVRGNYNEWYANKRISDLVIRIKNWLRDASAGELSENGNQFDPLRLEGYRGTTIYSYDKIAELVLQKKSFQEQSNFALALFENTAKDIEFPAFKFEKVISTDEFGSSLKNYIASIKELIENKTFKVKKYHIGYVIWSNSDDRFSDYDVKLPRKWQDFKRYCSQYSIDTSSLEAFIAEFPFNFFKEIPIITAIKRPKEIIGFSSFLEFVNFYIEFNDGDKGDKVFVNDIPVHFQAHNEPLTTGKAQLISGSTIDFNGAAIIGCGALGSKVGLHMVRNGFKDLLFLDDDVISPHNLVRHALLADSEGVNKAVALMNVAKNIFRSETISDSIVGLPISGSALFKEKMQIFRNQIRWIFDFTASDAFFQTLILISEGIEHIRICRGTISDHGYLGVLLFEGKNRNPRVDDLQILLFSSFNRLPAINQWLIREAQHGQGDVHLNVGIGCNSETTVLSDDIVSSHASYFSLVTKSVVLNAAENASGEVYLHEIDNVSFSIRTHHLSFPPLFVTHAVNDPTWEIRIKPGIIEIMKAEMGLCMPHETGGVFIGAVNYKSKTIHVVDLIKAPPDSTANSVCFFRGIYGLPEKVMEINQNSGNQLGYIGEWHTHPFGPNSMSNIDTDTVRKFKKEFNELSNPLPVFLSIITPTHLLCYVY